MKISKNIFVHLTMLVFLLLLAFVVHGCSSCSDKQKEQAEKAKQEELKPQAITGANTIKVEESKYKIALQKKAGDQIFGYSKDMKFFAYRQEFLFENSVAYALHVVPARFARPSPASKGVLYVSSRDLDIEKFSMSIKVQRTLQSFNKQALQILNEKGFTDKAIMGELLFEQDSYRGKWSPDSKIPSTFRTEISLEHYESCNLVLDTFKQVVEATKHLKKHERTAFGVSLELGLKGRSGFVKHLQNPDFFKRQVELYWLKSVIHSPDQKSLLLLIESYGSGFSADGRMELIAVGYPMDYQLPAPPPIIVPEGDFVAAEEEKGFKKKRKGK